MNWRVVNISAQSINAPIQSLVSRNYNDEADLLQMQALITEGRAHTDDWHYPHLGDLIFWFFMVMSHLDAQEFIRLWHADGKLAGYAILGEDPTFDCQVLPEYVYCGIEDAALQWVEKRLEDLRAKDAERWGGRLVSAARKDDQQRISFLEEHGFQPGGEFSEVNLLCSLDRYIPTMKAPRGWQVRPLEMNEISRRAAAHRHVWLPWTVGSVSEGDYAAFMRLPGYLRELDIVAVAPDGEIAAYVNGWVDPVNRIGDFGPVGTIPRFRRQGLGRAVLLECMGRMKRLGMNRLSASTGLSNQAAFKLYESVGFRAVNETIEFVRGA